jgi:light-regulated signal transduction histidine kinase (bacteriophytochrome)
MIRQLLSCLLTNAIRFTQSRPLAVIEVGGSSSDGERRYYVKDNGIGFDMKYADKLFKVFEHLQPGGQFEGCGTGLAMVKRIVTRHGGHVRAEGQVDVGATIHFTLPMKKEEEVNDASK